MYGFLYTPWEQVLLQYWPIHYCVYCKCVYWGDTPIRKVRRSRAKPDAMTELNLSARAYHCILKLTRTVADLAEALHASQSSEVDDVIADSNLIFCMSRLWLIKVGCRLKGTGKNLEKSLASAFLFFLCKKTWFVNFPTNRDTSLMTWESLAW